MDLRTYFETTRTRQVDLARQLGVVTVVVSQWTSGVRQVPAERCPAIERATAGQVRCEDLRPDVDWAVLRCVCSDQQPAMDPHPGGRPLIDPAQAFPTIPAPQGAKEQEAA